MKAKYFVLAGLLSGGLTACAQIRRVTAFREDARNASCSRDGRVFFERAGHVFLAGATPAADRRLTSEPAEFPEWRPAGHVIALVSHGWIVLLNADSGKVLETFPGTPVAGLRFSPDGARLAWFEQGAAQVRTGKTLDRVPMPQDLTFTAVDDFSMDGRELLVTAHAAGSSDPRQTEIYACLLDRPSCRSLTSNRTQRQDFARLSPSGRQLLFTSSETAWVPDAPIDYEADLWLQPLELPTLAKRMTWFNEPANPRYDPDRARVNAASWTRDGRRVIATVTEGPRQSYSRLVTIEFPEPE